ncbi:MAG: hypothetical protein R3248_05390 [Candidatus Promineifilaceae bacterium]|nr:hypothetical protein [Candidatus Promineifilaceae bacterium]
MDEAEDTVESRPAAGKERSSVARSWHYRLLWLVALASLALNLALFAGIYAFRQRAQEEVRNASRLLNTVEMEDFQLPVQVDETLPISLTVPFSDTFQAPISTTVPISTGIPFTDNIEVPVNTVIPVNTQIQVPVPVLGNVVVPIPIVTSIPVSLTVDVPISRTIPVQLDIPVNLDVEVPVESEVKIDTQVPIQLEFPVTIPFDEMGFQALLLQVQEALDVLAELLGTDTNFEGTATGE